MNDSDIISVHHTLLEIQRTLITVERDGKEALRRLEDHEDRLRSLESRQADFTAFTKIAIAGVSSLSGLVFWALEHFLGAK